MDSDTEVKIQNGLVYTSSIELTYGDFLNVNKNYFFVESAVSVADPAGMPVTSDVEVSCDSDIFFLGSIQNPRDRGEVEDSEQVGQSLFFAYLPGRIVDFYGSGGGSDLFLERDCDVDIKGFGTVNLKVEIEIPLSSAIPPV